MKKKFYFFVVILLIAGLTIQAQENSQGEILMTIDNYEITKAEFERIYNKNNTPEEASDPKSIEEYLELFINFKLKVIEAETLGLDTIQSFIDELEGYRKQLAKPYLVDQKVVDALLSEAYERYKQEVNAGHILIKIDKNAPDKDTLLAYKKALGIRDRILKGEDFSKVAKETSDDPSARKNGGNLGYFTAFQMVYDFESVAYSLDTGKVSMPLRTQFGYHIIKVFNKREAQGQIKVAHIMILTPKEMDEAKVQSAKDTIFDVYNKLKQDGDFAKLAKEYSQDTRTNSNGGELPWFGTGRMVKEFESAAFALKDTGDISEPIKTSFGWHIIKLLDKKGIDTYENMQAELKGKIARDSRASKSRKSVIEKLKNEYNFKQLTKISEFHKVVDESIFKGEWNADTASALNKDLFKLLDSTYSQQDFVKYLDKNQRNRNPATIEEFINNTYEKFLSKTVMKFEEDRLEIKYPEFKYLMQEYHDGILLFELTDKLVWTKAVKDTSGLEEFHAKNKNNYMWDNRLDITIYECKNGKTLKKASKLFKTKEKKGYSNEQILMSINKKDTLLIEKERTLFSLNDHKIVDRLFDYYNKEGNDKNVKVHSFAKEKLILCLNAMLEPQAKLLDEAKGLITADYQTYLEEEWIKVLKSKYQITINKDVLKTINK
jgi:peptidyl-prolyl cis-trans isomerase SurA